MQSPRPYPRPSYTGFLYQLVLASGQQSPIPLVEPRLDPVLYPHGRGPDTIRYFGRAKLPAYLEINQDGRLNLKVYLKDLNTDHQKQERVQKAEDYYQRPLGAHHPKKPRSRKLRAGAKSRTVMSFDVGLHKNSSRLNMK